NQNGTPLWEDLVTKATKLHTCLRISLGLLTMKRERARERAMSTKSGFWVLWDIKQLTTKLRRFQKSNEHYIIYER
ncbi:hypothetical protein L9F63_006138, partial [Diploptera punctata]